MLASRQLYLELLDKRSHVLVADNGTLVLLDTKDRLIDMDLQVALHLALATQTPMVLNLLTGEVWFLRIENLATTLKNLDLTLSTRGLTTTGRRQEDAILIERRHQVVALGYGDGTVAVDLDIHIARGREILLRYEQDNHQQDDYQEEYSYTICYKLCHTFLNV